MIWLFKMWFCNSYLNNSVFTFTNEIEELSDRQKLQLLNQLIAPGELQEAESLILVEGEAAGKCTVSNWMCFGSTVVSLFINLY